MECGPGSLKGASWLRWAEPRDSACLQLTGSSGDRSVAKLTYGIRRFHRDDRGGPALETVLILALVSIPLTIAIILFGRKVYDWLVEWLKHLG